MHLPQKNKQGVKINQLLFNAELTILVDKFDLYYVSVLQLLFWRK